MKKIFTKDNIISFGVMIVAGFVAATILSRLKPGNKVRKFVLNEA